MIRRRTLERLTLALAVVLTAASCTILSPFRFRVAPTNGPGPHVLVVGDSNLAYAGPALQWILGSRFTSTIDAQPGITTADPRWPSWLRADVAASRPSVVVVQLGTNDAYASRVGAFPAALDRIMRALPAGVPVLWSDVRVISGVGPEWVGAEWAVDRMLVQATSRWPNLRILDYAGHFAHHPQWVRPDSVHLTRAGDAEYARWIAGAVSSRAR